MSAKVGKKRWEWTAGRRQMEEVVVNGWQPYQQTKDVCYLCWVADAEDKAGLSIWEWGRWDGNGCFQKHGEKTTFLPNAYVMSYANTDDKNRYLHLESAAAFYEVENSFFH